MRSVSFIETNNNLPIEALALLPLFEYTKGMRQGLIFIASVGLAASFSIDCHAQERDSSQLNREEWQAKVQASRERIELMRRQHSSFIPQEPGQNEIAETASKRVLEDDSLQPGDIVSTTQGLFRFRGATNKQRTPDDFVRIR